MPDPVKPGRDPDSLADVVELLLDKGVVLNADIVVSVGETELLGIRLRAALASFETASEFGLEFPSGTDMEAVEEASQRRRRAKMSPSARPGLEGDGEREERDDEDRSVDVMNATIGEAADEQSADEGEDEPGNEPETADEDGEETGDGDGDGPDDGDGDDPDDGQEGDDG